MDKTIKQYLIDTISELKFYLIDDDYDDLEKHDITISIKAYQDILKFINNNEV